MNKKILICVIIGLIFVCIVALFTLSSEQTTKINNKLLNGTIKGIVVEDNGTDYLSGWKIDYNNSEKRISYEFLMADSLDLTKEGIINLMGGEKVVTKEYNGVKWDIYFLDPTHDLDYDTAGFSVTQQGYLCFASGKNGDYMITVGGGPHSNSSMNTDLFENYVEPLLNNITLKDPQNPPKEYYILDSTKEDYDRLSNYVNQYGWETIKNNMIL